MRKLVVCVFIGIGLIVCTLLICKTMLSSANSMLSEQQEQLYDLENKLAVKRSAKENADKQLLQATTGLSNDRTVRDDEVAAKFVKMVLTWDSSEKYDAIRKSVMDEYGLDKEDPFMTVFLAPDMKVAAVDEDGTIRTVSYIDTYHLNAHYERMRSYVMSIYGDVYTYFNLVTWSASDQRGNEAESTAIMIYDINADGVMSNLKGYLITP